MITPNLDRLVKEGCTFASAYSPNPVCIPARHNLLTGLTTRYHGYFENNKEPMNKGLLTLPELLSDHGYVTHAAGKMHFVPPRRHYGFDRMELMEEIPGRRNDDDYALYLKENGLGHILNIHGVRNLLYMQPQRSLIPHRYHGTTWVGDRSVAFIENHTSDRPFFLWSSFIAPHPPWDVVDEFAGIYRGRVLPEPIGSPAERSSSEYNEKYLRRIRELYYGAITHVDEQIGRILLALEKRGMLDNTLVIHTSDHGEMLGDHGRFQKGLPYESSARIPFIVRYPARLSAGSTIYEFADLNDVLPTALDAAGIQYPGNRELPGGSLFRNDKNRTLQYMEHHFEEHRWIAVRDVRYKYIYHYSGGRETLFDLAEDPDECVNILESESLRAGTGDVRNRLRRALLEWEKKWGLPGNIINDEFRVFDVSADNNKTWKPALQYHYPMFSFHEPGLSAENRHARFEREIYDASRDELPDLCDLDLAKWEHLLPPGFTERAAAGKSRQD